MVRIFAAFLALASLAGLEFARAQERDFSKVEIRATDLGNGLYMLRGEGGNIALAVARDGIAMVDTQFAPLSEKIKTAIRAISTAPLRYIVNTHLHGDHIGGNRNFAREGAIIVAHENARRSMMQESRRMDGTVLPPVPSGAEPTVTYTKTLTLHLTGQTIRLIHPGPSHTNTDSFVYFPEADVLATGDLFSTDRYPFIDVDNGGGIDGMIEAADQMLSLARDTTKIVPGHGPLADRPALVKYRAALTDWRGRIAALKAQGKSADEAIAAKPLAGYDAAYQLSPGLSDRTVRLIYRSLP